MNFDKSFWSNLLRESDGTPSSARLLTATIVFSALFWVTFITCTHKALPDLQPVGAFVGTTTLALYGINKGAGVLSDIFSKNK